MGNFRWARGGRGGELPMGPRPCSDLHGRTGSRRYRGWVVVGRDLEGGVLALVLGSRRYRGWVVVGRLGADVAPVTRTPEVVGYEVVRG